MDKKIPKVFANKIDKEVGNNERVYYGNDNNHEFRNDGLNINQKINQIFGSSKYVYKADVIIKLKDKIISKKIIGRNRNQLITMDNELININDIVDIDYE